MIKGFVDCDADEGVAIQHTDRTLIVVGDPFSRDKLRGELAIEASQLKSKADANPWFHVVAPCESIPSQRFDEILICVGLYSEIIADKHKKQWFDESVRVRLGPNGGIIFYG